MRIRILLSVLALSLPAIAADREAQRGRQIFDSVGCYQCHGYVGQGGAAGLRLAPELLPYDAFAQFVRGTTGAMPAYSEGLLAEGDLRAIYAFLQTVPKGPDVDSIPILRNLR